MQSKSDEQAVLPHRGGVIGAADSGTVHGNVAGARRAQQPGLSPRGTKQIKAPEEYRLSKQVSTVREIVTTFAGPQPSRGESPAVPRLNCTDVKSS